MANVRLPTGGSPLFFAALVAAALLGSSGASAQLLTFDFRFSFVSGADYGTLVGAFTAAQSGTPNVYNIQGINGTLGGSSASLLGQNTFMGNDNILKYPQNPGYFTVGGVSFKVNETPYNLYYYGTIGGKGFDYAITAEGASGSSVYSGTVVQAAPGPAAGMGLLSFVSLSLAVFAARFRACLDLSKRAFRRALGPARQAGSPARDGFRG